MKIKPELSAYAFTVAIIVALVAGCSSPAKYDSKNIGERGAAYQRAPGASADVTPLVGVGPNAGSPYPGERNSSDEIWVIQKPTAAAAPLPGDAQLDHEGVGKGINTEARCIETPPFPAAPSLPGQGQLLARTTPDAVPVAIPLLHTDVQAHVTGYVASVDVVQQYHNPYAEKIEALYVFPLPENAAVSDFVMTIGDRTIRGIIREKEQARQIYNDAKAQGYTASLMTQERPNVFTQSVANIEPGKRIDVSVTYFNTLRYEDGWYEFVFPMVVGPRFNPPGNTHDIGAAPVGMPVQTGQRAEVQYRDSSVRNGNDISLRIELDAGVALAKIESTNHRVDVQQLDASHATVKLRADDTVPNKDFVLRFKVAGAQTKTALLTQPDKDGRGGTFSLMLIPPETTGNLERRPVEMVFTLDVSGSMSGKPIEQAKAAMRYALAHMNPGDTFRVIKFAGDATAFHSDALPATPENTRRALAFVEQADAGGGTMMLDGVTKSLLAPRDETRTRFVLFLTDGLIGNEIDILRAVKQNAGGAHLFGFGVGSSTNRYLLDGMARFGDGVVAYLGLNDRGDAVMAAAFDRLSRPALTDVTIDWHGTNTGEIYPQRVPDLFVGRPFVLTGRYTGAAPTKVTVRAKSAGHAVATDLEAVPTARSGLREVWARQKIAYLSDVDLLEPSADTAGVVKATALENGLLSAYTSFIAVDSSRVTDGNHGTTVAVPVPMPDGVRYDKTVGNGRPVGEARE